MQASRPLLRTTCALGHPLCVGCRSRHCTKQSWLESKGETRSRHLRRGQTPPRCTHAMSAKERCFSTISKDGVVPRSRMDNVLGCAPGLNHRMSSELVQSSWLTVTHSPRRELEVPGPSFPRPAVKGTVVAWQQNGRQSSGELLCHTSSIHAVQRTPVVSLSGHLHDGLAHGATVRRTSGLPTGAADGNYLPDR